MWIPTILFVFKLGILLVASLQLLGVDARNVTVNNTSPLVVYSPTPCFLANVPGCSTEWVLTPYPDAFNGSTTSTTGISLGLSIVPRASLTFQGSSILFIPGQNSTATATVVVDNLTSILLDTTLDVYSGTGLDPLSNHTITITFVPGDGPSTLDIDHFIIGQPDQIINVTSSASSTLAPTPFPTTTSPPTATATNNTKSTTHTPPGTIAALSLSAALILLFALLAWFLALRRGRRRTALQREKAILYDLRLPSERGGSVGVKDERGVGVGKEAELKVGVVKEAGRLQPNLNRQRDLEGQRDPQDDHPTTTWQGPQDAQAQRKEKGKARERSWVWRESILPPVHYTPWH